MTSITNGVLNDNGGYSDCLRFFLLFVDSLIENTGYIRWVRSVVC